MLRKLHPDPKAMSLGAAKQLERHIDDAKVGLRSAARTVARLVRGGAVQRGRHTGELSPREEDAQAYIRKCRREGISDEQILEELRARHGFRRPVRFGVAGEGNAWPDMKMADLQRLGKLGEVPELSVI